jgi:hypothetical protein
LTALGLTDPETEGPYYQVANWHGRPCWKLATDDIWLGVLTTTWIIVRRLLDPLPMGYWIGPLATTDDPSGHYTPGYYVLGTTNVTMHEG